MSAPSLPSRARATHVDLLRLVAAWQMIQGHTLDALLEDGARTGPLFAAWDWARGLTSVGFLFAAGLAYHLTTLPRFERHRADPAASRRRFLRALLLIALGYALHLPFGALGVAEAWRTALIVDVLQCIGVTLAILEGLTLAASRPRTVVAACGALLAAAILLGPLTAGLRPEGPFGFVLHYLTDAGGSLFPLLPWSGYMLAGVVAGALASPQGASSPRGRTAVVLGGMGVALLATSLAGIHLARGAIKLASYDLLKLAVVILLATALALVALRVRRLPRAMTVLSGETLVLYVAHLLVVYGSGVGLYHVVGHTLPLPAALAAALAMVVATFAFGLLWQHARDRLTAPLGARLAGGRGTG